MGGILVVAEARRGELREVSFELIGAALPLKEAAGGRAGGGARSTPSPSATRRRSAPTASTRCSRCARPWRTSRRTSPQRALAALIEREQPALVLAGHTIDCAGLRAGGRGARAPRLRERRHRRSAGRTARSRRAAPTATSSSTSSSSRARAARCCCCAPARSRPPTPGGGGAPARAVERRRSPASRAREHVELPRGRRRATSTSRRPTSCSRSAAASRSKDNIARFEELAERLGATLSVSRPLVDAGWMPSARQVGQSGQDRQAAGLPRARDLRRRPAPRRDAHGGDDHRRQHRSGGADLRRRALRGGGRHVRARRRARGAARVGDACRAARAASDDAAGLLALRHLAEGALVRARGQLGAACSPTACARPIAQVPPGRRGRVAAGARAGRARSGGACACCSTHRTIARRDRTAGWAHRGDLLRLHRCCSRAR